MAAAHERFAQLVYAPDPIDGTTTVTDYRWQPGDPRRYGQSPGSGGSNTWYDQTPAESAASVTPTNYYYPPYRAERYGASGDGVTSNTAILQTPFVNLLAQGIQTFTFGQGAFYFATPLTFSAANSKIRLVGTSMAGEFGNTPAETRFIGASGQDSIIKFTGTFFSLEVEHITFDGQNASTGVTSAILSTSEGSPARPINIHHCTFITFAKAIASVVAAGGTNTGISTVNIVYNVFQGNTYALFGTGDINSIMNFNFSNNVAEQGGRIRIESNGLGGSGLIANNLMEGQSDPIYVTGGTCTLAVERNYFESNTGTLITFTPNASASLKIANNDYVSFTPTATVDNCYLDCQDSINISGSGLINKSKVRSTAFYGSTSSFINNLDVNVVAYQKADPASLASTGALFRTGATLANTPLGIKGYEQFTTNSSLYRTAQSLSIGDSVIVAALIKSISATTVQVLLYDNASVLIASTPVIALNAIGEYTLIHAAIPATATSTGNYKIRFTVDSTKVAWAMDFFTYKVAAPSSTTAVYVYYPDMIAGGTAVISSGTTTVTVSNTLPIKTADSNAGPLIIVQGTDKTMGATEVVSIGDSSFVINVATAPGSNKNVFWSAQ